MRRLTAVAVNLASVSQQMISVGLLIGGFYRFQEGEMTMGAIIAIIMLSGRSLQPVGQLAFLITRGKQAFATLDSLQRMMEADDERQVAMRSIVPEIRAGHIELHRRLVPLSERRARIRSSDSTSRSIRASGSGSSAGSPRASRRSAACCAASMRRPTGEMLVDGLDSRQYHPHQLRDAFRFVGQDAEVFSGTVRDNLMLGAAKADDQQLIDAVVRSGADIFLSRDAAGFDLPVGERGSRLSGGQRSLLVLARALVSPSKMLFLDEPTGSMDTQTELYFIEHLKTALAPDQALVVATHRHNMLSILDRLIVIDGGKIIADGPRDEVLKHLTAGRCQTGAGPRSRSRDRARSSPAFERFAGLRIEALASVALVLGGRRRDR